MVNKEQLIDGFALNLSLIRRQCDGLEHEDSLRQPPFRGNCLNWVLGHILVGRDRVLHLLGEKPTLSTEEKKHYETNSDPITEDSEENLELADLLARLRSAQEHISTGLQRATPEDLSKAIDIENPTVTIGKEIFGLYFHDTYHTGQTELLRQMAGTNDKVV